MVYRVVLSTDIEPLCRKVSELLNAGWVCVGGMISDPQNYSQAIMIDKLPEGEEISYEPIIVYV